MLRFTEKVEGSGPASSHTRSREMIVGVVGFVCYHRGSSLIQLAKIVTAEVVKRIADHIGRTMPARWGDGASRLGDDAAACVAGTTLIIDRGSRIVTGGGSGVVRSEVEEGEEIHRSGVCCKWSFEECRLESSDFEKGEVGWWLPSHGRSCLYTCWPRRVFGIRRQQRWREATRTGPDRCIDWEPYRLDWALCNSPRRGRRAGDGTIANFNEHQPDRREVSAPAFVPGQFIVFGGPTKARSDHQGGKSHPRPLEINGS